ncbi:hypothetical protein BT69DRAFT_6642 [Atractiella rhizophila]|nr:hypothetical protein BT69DRAFT_6642 [Atractiella rhizophila]
MSKSFTLNCNLVFTFLPALRPSSCTKFSKTIGLSPSKTAADPPRPVSAPTTASSYDISATLHSPSTEETPLLDKDLHPPPSSSDLCSLLTLTDRNGILWDRLL